MAVPKRHGHTPGTYFVTSRTWESRALFLKSPACQIFVDTLFRYRDEGAYEVHAFARMPDHFHVLLTPAPEKTLERAVQCIKGGSAHSIRGQLNFRLPVWQRGFSDHRIRDQQEYAIHERYIEANPVKSRLAATIGDYPWSSASGRFKLDDPPQRLKPLGMAVASLRHG